MVYPGFSQGFPVVFQGFSQGFPEGCFVLEKSQATSLKKIFLFNFFKDKLRNFFKIVSVLLSALVERFFVFHMQDFYIRI